MARSTSPRAARAKTQPLQAEVVVVGGGLSGLTMAAALGAAGVNVICLDRDAPKDQLAVKFDGRTTAVSYGSMQILKGCGIWQKLANMAEPIRQIRVTDQNSPLHLHFPEGAVNGQPFGWIVDNRELRKAMFARLKELKSVTHLAPLSVKSIHAGEAHTSLKLSDGRTLKAKLVIGADGKDSLCRTQAGIEVRNRAYDQTALVCTIQAQYPHEGVALENFYPGGPFAVLPMTDNRASIVWSESADKVAQLMALDEDDFITELNSRIGTDWLGEVKLVSQRFAYPLNLLHAKTYIGERLALISEAAHRMHPIAGQGLNVGMRDIALLAELVVDAARKGEDVGNTKLLKAYQRGRKPDTFAMLAGTDFLTHLFSNNLPVVAQARRLGLAAVERAPRLKGFFMRYAMGLVGPQSRLGSGYPL